MALTIDYTKAETVNQIFPATARSFINLNQQTYLGQHHQPKHKTPEYRTEQHVISIFLGESLLVEQWWNERYFKTNLVAGDVSIYPAHQIQQVHWHQDFHFLDIYFDPALVEKTRERLNIETVDLFPCPVVQDPLLRQMGLAIKTAFEDELLNVATSRLYVDTLLHTLLIYGLKQQQCPMTNAEISNNRKLSASTLKTAVSFIQENLDQDLSLTKISSSVHMGAHYFATLFKQSTGQTPHQFVISRRLARAKQLLVQKELSIASIAKQVGFRCPSHFSKVFRKQVKMTPKAYRQRL